MPGPLVIGAAAIGSIGVINTLNEPLIETVRQHVWSISPNKILTPQELAVAARRSLRDYDVLKELAQRSGFADDQFRLLTDLQRQFMAAEQVINLVRRGEVNQDAARDYLHAMGYADSDVDGFFTLSTVIPGIADLMMMAVKGAFTPQEVETFRLDEQFPEVVAEWAAKQGLTREWALNYWRSHWNLPSPQQVFEMAHRGAIEPEVVDIYLRAADYSVYWREALKKITYNPLTRVDTRRLLKDGIITLPQVKRSYLDQGYDEEKATWLTEWTQKNATVEKKQELKDLTDGLKASILSGLVAGSVTEESARLYLADMGYGSEEIEAYVAYAELLREEKIAARIVERVGDLYVKDLATIEETTQALRDAGRNENEIALRFREWDIERELRAPAASTEKERDLTKSEIIAAYKDGLSTRDEAQSDLRDMRYDDSEVERLLSLADFDVAKTIQKEEIESVKNEVLRGLLDETTATTRLDALHLRSTQKKALLSSWFRQVEGKVFDVPLSMVQDMALRGIIEGDAITEYLVRLGVRPIDQERILALWGDKAAEKKLRAENAAAKKAKA